MKRLVLTMLSLAALAACPKHKKVVDAGVVAEDAGAADAGAVADAGAGARDAGTVPGADAGVKEAAVGGSLITVSGPVERSSKGEWKLAIQLAPAEPGATPSAPAAASQLAVVVSSASGTTTTGLQTQFEMQGINATGPISEGSAGSIVPTTILVPSDAITLGFVVDGKPLTTIVRKSDAVKVTDLKAKPGATGIDVAFSFEPKSPVSWVLSVEKHKGEWTQVANGDDQKTSAVVPPDAEGDDVGIKLAATDGFNVVSQIVRSPKPKAEAPADAGAPPSTDAGP